MGYYTICHISLVLGGLRLLDKLWRHEDVMNNPLSLFLSNTPLYSSTKFAPLPSVVVVSTHLLECVFHVDDDGELTGRRKRSHRRSTSLAQHPCLIPRDKQSYNFVWLFICLAILMYCILSRCSISMNNNQFCLVSIMGLNQLSRERHSLHCRPASTES